VQLTPGRGCPPRLFFLKGVGLPFVGTPDVGPLPRGFEPVFDGDRVGKLLLDVGPVGEIGEVLPDVGSWPLP
jgi:hypothetical protein